METFVEEWWMGKTMTNMINIKLSNIKDTWWFSSVIFYVGLN